MPPEQVRQLSRELEQLAGTVYGSNAFVFDAWGLVWCRASSLGPGQETMLLGQIKSILEGTRPPLPRGGKLDTTFSALSPPMSCRSFATVYVLGIWISSNSTEFLLRSSVRDALPRIEALTLSLPPPGGADPSSGAQHGRA